MQDLTLLTAKELAAGYRSGEYTAVRVAEAYCEKIQKENPKLNAYLEVYDDVLDQAEAADRLLQERGNDAHLLCGVPIAVKDNILLEGKVASAASQMLAQHRATYDATAIKKLKEAGAVFLGRTNMDEFAMGSSTESSAFGPTKNPIDTSRTPGGSSGGSAAAVAAQLAPLALGTDTGGSVRQPASLCGVYGLKPTYGAVSRFGLIAMGSSLDQLGIFARTTSDVESLFYAVEGIDENDSTTLPKAALPRNNKRIGVPRDFVAKASPDVVQEFDRALEKLQQSGYEIVTVSLPAMAHALAAYYIVMPAEVSTNLARYDGMRYGFHEEASNLLDEYTKTRARGFGAEPLRRIMLGTYVLSAGYFDAYYKRATALRGALVSEFEAAFRDISFIATPTSPEPAFKIGEKQDPLSLYLEDIFTVSANLAGIPALSVPFDSAVRDGTVLPVGIQFMTEKRGESSLFEISRDLLGE